MRGAASCGRYDAAVMVSHTLVFRVRYAECDPMGVAHHTAYPIWFEMGRTELLRESQPGRAELTYRDLEAQGIYLAVVSLAVRYRRPARYDDLLTLKTTLTAAAHVKIEHEYELFRDTMLLATGTTTLACLDAHGQPRALPGFLRAE
jgi:acyl-CoA thioester hydrolase